MNKELTLEEAMAQLERTMRELENPNVSFSRGIELYGTAAELLTEPASVLSDSDAALRMAAETGTVSSLGGQSLFFIAVGVALSLADLTLGIRRSHDLGKSGWYLLWMLVPFANLYVLIKLWCFRGTAGPNRFGPDPLAGAGA